MTAATQTVAVQSTALPWHDALWAQLQRTWRDARWPHGLLLHGPDGVGKRLLAERIARSLLCDRSDPASANWSACGECASCKLLDSGTHPDLLWVVPAEDKQQIAIDQIRSTCAELALTSYRSGYKVAIVDPAHRMTLAAANSLLKTLEEPAPNTCLILLTARPGVLLPTLRSRCQQFAVRAPAAADGLQWLHETVGKSVSAQLLRFAHGAPLRALALAEGGYEVLTEEVDKDLDAVVQGRQDVTHIAKRWGTDTLNERLLCLDHWLTARIRAAFLGTADPITSEPLPSGAEQLNINRLYACLDRVRALQAQLSRTALQRELAVDAVLVDVLAALAPRRR